MHLDESTTGKLQELLTLSIDSWKGFEQAAEHVGDTELANLLRCLASDRRTAANDLQQVLHSAGEEPSASGSMIRRAQRWWLGMRTRNGSDAEVMVGDAAQTDSRLANLYDEVLIEVHGGDIRELLASQRTLVKRAQLRVQILREALEMAH